MNIIPEDVERYILEWIWSSTEMATVERVCKRWKGYIRISSFYLEKAQAMNRLLMILEDEESMTQGLREALGSYWGTMYKWSWPRYVEPQPEEEEEEHVWEVGKSVDALDRINVWGPAVIIDRRPRPSIPILAEAPTVEEFQVRFHGWSIGFNEWVPPSKLAPLGSKSINPRDLFRSLPEEHSSWALCRHEDTWELESLRILDTSGNTHVLSTGSTNLSVTADNITDHVRASSNTATYLLLSGRRFRPDGRNLAL